jgi:endonuclease/exonuclease/phosphatase family metal-dependent hydrolase
MEQGTEGENLPASRAPAVPAGLDAATAIGLAASLPLWRAVLPGNTYVLGGELLRVDPSAIPLTFIGALAGLGLLLALPAMVGARLFVEGRGRALTSFGLLLSAGLLLLFQHGAPEARWAAAVASLPVTTLVLVGLARRATTGPAALARYVNGWFAGLLVDLVLRYAAGTYDVPWQRERVPVFVAGALAAAAVVAAVISWPRRRLPEELRPTSATAWIAIPGALYLAMAGTQNIGGLSAEMGRPLSAAATLCAGYLLIGWAITRGALQGPGLGEICAGVLLILLAIVGPEWETFCLALFGPPIVGSVVASSVVAPSSRRVGRAAAAGFFGLLAVWIAICLAGLREGFYDPEGRCLDGLWIGVALLGAARAQFGARLPDPEERWAYAGLSGAFFVAASVLTPAGSPNASRPLTSSLVAMTYNIHRGVGLGGDLDLEGIARTIEQDPAWAKGRREPVDLVGLQEVSRGRKTEAGTDELAWLAERLGMDYAFAPTFGPNFGVALLSRSRILRSRIVRFRNQGDRPAVVLVASVQADPALTVAVTQFDPDQIVRRHQAEELARAVVPGDAILCVDLASDSRMRAYPELTGFGRWADAFHPGPRGGYNFPASHPDQRRDVVLFRGTMTSQTGEVRQSPASTHFPVDVRFSRP